MSFLTAEWRKLAIANYSIHEELLQKYLPAGTVLDLWNGKCYVSLVGFMFVNTKLLGLKIPFHTNFEEVNLRFYVKHFDGAVWKRGVVFIKEIVPKHAITFIANTVYKENYETMPMQHTWLTEKESRTVQYKWKKKSKWHALKINAGLKKLKIEAKSKTEFITEHYWGYAKVNENVSNEYEVRHPKWEVYKVMDYEIDVDFGLIYGNAFKFLNTRTPDSVMLAEGSEITVEGKSQIKI